MSKHQEPWKRTGGNIRDGVATTYEFHVLDVDGKEVSFLIVRAGYGYEDYKERYNWAIVADRAFERIVACVNACAGISTDDLQKRGVLFNKEVSLNAFLQEDDPC